MVGENRGYAMNRSFLFGATVAAGAVLLVPGVAQALSRAGRPVMRAAVRTGAVAYKEFQKAGAEVYEHIEDIAAEFEAEIRRARSEAGEPDDAAAAADDTAEGTGA